MEMKSCALLILFPLLLLSGATGRTPSFTPDECGPEYGGQVCPGDECCSAWSHCGWTEPYCGPGCQPEYGVCWDHAPPPPPPTPSPPPPPPPSPPPPSPPPPPPPSPPPPPPFTPDECGPEFGGQVCPNDECCSQWGHCGWTEAYCGTGCQTGYGVCWDHAPPPPPIPSPPPPLAPSPSPTSPPLAPSPSPTTVDQSSADITSLITKDTYDAFLAAINTFGSFRSENEDEQKISICLAQISYQKIGGRKDAGYCWVTEIPDHPKHLPAERNYLLTCPSNMESLPKSSIVEFNAVNRLARKGEIGSDST